MNKKIISHLIVLFSAMGCAGEKDLCQQTKEKFSLNNVSCEFSSKDNIKNNLGSYYCSGNSTQQCCCHSNESYYTADSGSTLDAKSDDVTSDATVYSNVDGYRSRFNKEVSENESVGDGLEQIVTSEQDGVSIIRDILLEQQYFVGIKKDCSEIMLENPKTKKYVTIMPDICFKKKVEDVYSYLEFDSVEDTGVGFSTMFPFYKEVKPDTKEKIGIQVKLYLNSMKK